MLYTNLETSNDSSSSPYFLKCEQGDMSVSEALLAPGHSDALHRRVAAVVGEASDAAEVTGVDDQA